jgi:hypothetical protein
MLATPAANPATDPPALSTEATKLLLLLHSPPAVVSVSRMEDPTQTFTGPKIADGVAFMVSVAALKQPVGSI